MSVTMAVKMTNYESHQSPLALPHETMKKYGFHKILATKDRDESKGYDAGYTHCLRIDVLQFLLYDRNGFITWWQKSDKLGVRGSSTDAYITIPKPIRTEDDLKNLLTSITN